MTTQVIINDQPFELGSAQNLLDLLERFGATEPFVVAINQEFVPRSCYAKQKLSADDRIEILQPIQGG